MHSGFGQAVANDCLGGCNINANDKSHLAAVGKILLEGVARITLLVQTTKYLLKFCEAFDFGGRIDGSLLEDIDERRIGSADTGGRVTTAGDLLNVNAWAKIFRHWFRGLISQRVPFSGDRLFGRFDVCNIAGSNSLAIS